MSQGDQLSLDKVVAVAVGGALGGGLRYAIVFPFQDRLATLPWVILLENVLGAFLLGLILTLSLHKLINNVQVRLFLTTGVLGSFTTFSTMSYDLAAWLLQGALGTALGYAGASIFLGLMAAYSGVTLGQRWLQTQA